MLFPRSCRHAGCQLRHERLLVWLLVCAVAIALAVSLFLQQTRVDRELRSVPSAERRALYERTLETLRKSCAPTSPSALDDYCRDQSAFIKQFPECNKECQRLAARSRRLPWH